MSNCRNLPVLGMQPRAPLSLLLLLLIGLHRTWCASPDEAVFVPGSLPLDNKGRQVPDLADSSAALLLLKIGLQIVGECDALPSDRNLLASKSTPILQLSG